MNRLDLEVIKPLVGENVKGEVFDKMDYHVSDKFGVFVPESGCCFEQARENHAHPAFSFIVFSDPEESFFEETIDLPSNHYLGALIGPNVPHKELVEDDFTKGLVVFIEQELFANCYHSIAKRQFSVYHGFELFPIHENVVTEISRFMEEQTKCVPPRMKELLGESITLQLIRSYEKEDVFPKPVITVFDVDGILDYMQQNLGKPIYMHELAEKAGVSKDHFNRWFKRQTGKTPLDCLIQIRLKEAKRLLTETGTSITEIARTCGFGNIGHFSAAFKGHFKMTPTAFRRKHYRENLNDLSLNG
ncbi:MAG: AraC family transcriptional regulator [Eubacteriaceae bacterium]|jgi:AraC-like DNA-binding protein|nr:AraC family transcriptional regulator [Eubacteriaceae bacterium]MDK2904121.1 AraC family transcriptional regulator [Eubacteriaceae bacterium]MDK2935059.1 AraC family transcriptional regulator [Eubacteriaceae bacterium]MDK2961443.1 AraC family transcriptional regulator [Eubacteriaceae bacterium]MDN5306810.1 AraC family transcriptional regulator [Eubacteriaceae bacterium]